MFTGLIADIGTLRAIDAAPEGARLRIATALAAELAPGDSIATDGCCLTATTVDGDELTADVMPVTLQRTSLGALGPGDPVNLELALRASDRLGGHVVQGHVDGVGAVAEREADGFATRLRITCDPGSLRYLVDRGSIALQGVSLTVAALHDDGFTVSLIPETLVRTTLGRLPVGRAVNLEFDVLAKYVERLVHTARPANLHP
ncbi:MAG: riboflavin synthase [Solirubrobacterales bacterium]